MEELGFPGSFLFAKISFHIMKNKAKTWSVKAARFGERGYKDELTSPYPMLVPIVR